ncbi:V-type proton ATPase subunit F [Gracilariopsis chorda]|uniref:V-type proton ATPase subunit F n=1 Tax=Gracilariopsis chorda TaxID=448386 RepID=A0A2V3IZ55_9FLOR|nr:V-type proton ATPase subunit F [Gracilariopsis chorda]|eukprot:PXF47355.1 V-type proton ATPase subunit F [Gracilariopsis chorda]
MAGRRQLKSREGGFLIAVIGDEDTTTGFLLAGVGDNQPSHGSNFFVVDPKHTPVQAIEEAFNKFTEREDIAIILINQYIADKIRTTVTRFNAPVPAILEIPSKEHPYDPSKDGILQRVRGMLGSA